MKKYKLGNVFVPGGLPKLTYNPRTEHKLENRLSEANDNLCKLVMVTGLTKSGKTVLVQKIFPRNEVVWIDGGSFTNEEDFWAEINNQLNSYTNFSETKSVNNTTSVEGGLEGQGGILIVKAKVSGKAEVSHSKDNQKSFSRSVGNKTAAITSLRNNFIPLVIDDFHYIKRETQGTIVRALKSLIFDGLPVIFIAIPHRRLDVVKVEREMTGRIETIKIPSWTIDELKFISNEGFPLLNTEIDDSITSEMANNALGSPHLMQEFCREICREFNVKETLNRTMMINNKSILPNIFERVADGTGRLMFDKLSRGPRVRSDRIKRKLKSGSITDIYGVVLYALAEMKPGIETLHYEDIRATIKDVSSESPPQAHEISRVLEHMSKISAGDESSTPVIDWEKEDRELHVTDPFFAYYLKWGVSTRQKYNTTLTDFGKLS